MLQIQSHKYYVELTLRGRFVRSYCVCMLVFGGSESEFCVFCFYEKCIFKSEIVAKKTTKIRKFNFKMCLEENNQK